MLVFLENRLFLRYICGLIAALQTFFCIFVIGVQSSGIHPENCRWSVKIVDRENTSAIHSFISPGGSYFLRIQVLCNSKINSEVSRYLALLGVVPKVHIESKVIIPDENGYHTSQLVNTVETAIVDLGQQENCYCLTSATRCYCDSNIPMCANSGLKMTTNCSDCMEYDCSISSGLCNPAWLAPLSPIEWTTSLVCTIENFGIGPYLDFPSTIFHVDSFHDSQKNNTIGARTASFPKVVKPVSLNCVTQHSPVCVVTSLPLSNVALYSNSEFATMEIIQVSDIFNGTSVCSEHYPSLDIIKDAISILDTVIFNTPVGLIEVKGSLQSPLPIDHATKNNVLRQCIKHLVGPSAVASQVATVLAVGDKPHQDKIFTANIIPGKSVVFRELLDSNSSNACHFMNTHLGIDVMSCSVVTGSVGSDGTVLLLLEVNDSASSTQYHIVKNEASRDTSQWVLVYSIPTRLPYTHSKALIDTNGTPSIDHNENSFIIDQSFEHSTNTTQQPILAGLSHTAIIGNDVFLWGNMLLYSPHGGLSLQKLTSFPSNSNITLFTSCFDGTYAFLTDNNEVWVGVVGTAMLLKLETTPNTWLQNPLLNSHDNVTLVTMFFDSSGTLQQIVGNTENCISRQQVPLHDVVTSLIYHKTRLENWKESNFSSSNNNSCPSTTSEETTSFPLNYVKRKCPYAKMTIHALRSDLFSRKIHTASKPPRIHNSTLQHSANELVEHFSRGSEFEAVGDRFDDGLPEEISLHRLESYTFELYLYLDYQDPVDTSRHSWTIDHLRASFYVSDPTLMNVTSERKELVALKTVKYQVTVQDKGVPFTQHPPGEALVPVSLILHTWRSAFSCWEESGGDRNNVKSPQVMTVYLGCPGNRQVVFDAQLSMTAEGQNHYCDAKDDVPCFLYERVFYPLFNTVDLATGHETAFLGQYTLKIVGGGLDLNSMRDYTTQEQQSFNFKSAGSTSSLIWAAKEKTLATIPVFNRSTNGIQWLCGTESPCANVDPKFMDNAQFYFKVEFSNRGVADTNCDYTLRFIMRVHGLPPGSLYPSSIIVLSCLGIIITIVMTLFIFKRQEQKLIKQIKGYITEFLNTRGMGSSQNTNDVGTADLEMETVQAQRSDNGPFRNRGIAWEKQDQSSKDASIDT